MARTGAGAELAHVTTTGVAREATDVRLLLADGKRWRLMEIGTALTWRPLPATIEAFGQIPYTVADPAVVTWMSDPTPEPAVLGVKGRLADFEAGVQFRSVGKRLERLIDSPAGLKDRQGLTIQYMTLARGREVHLATSELKIEPVGFARAPLTSADSLGNAFELTVRALRRGDLHRLRVNLPLMREHGTLNYFDDQRFGSLTGGQGWIYRELCLGRAEVALRTLLGARSPRDDERHRRFKEGLERHWGDWRACRDDAGRFGAHHSVFEHLAKTPGDFAGAFQHIATRTKLIHLFAWQSHLWNRVVSTWIAEKCDPATQLVSETVEGPLVFPGGPQHLNGEQALTLARMRSRSVFERARHQNMVMCALRRKIERPETILRLPAIISSFMDNIQTDLTPEQISQLACLGTQMPRSNISFVSFPLGLFESDETYDPVLEQDVFIWKSDFRMLRRYVSEFQAGTWPSTSGAPEPGISGCE